MTSNLKELFRPKSVAIIGISSKLNTLSRKIYHNMKEFKYTGVIYLVNPSVKIVETVKVYPTVLDIPGPVDLAVIIVNRHVVPSVLEQCGKKGVKAAVIITAGFKEKGPEGLEREEQLLKICEKYSIRVIGPNCMGIINTDPDIRLNATFAMVQPILGNIGFITQSGALGEILLRKADEENIGLSKFFSIGNKMDVSSNDLLETWMDDPDISLILMYLEDFGNPRKFAKLARKITLNKPIIAVKAARTFAGQKAASSHTGALIGSDAAVDAIFEQVGITRANTIEELFDYAKGFQFKQKYQGDRVAIITNAGGPAIMATDAFISDGFKLAEFDKKTIDVIKRLVPEEGTIANPIDLIASGTPDQFQKIMDTVLKDSNVDFALLIYISPLYQDIDEVIGKISEVVRKTNKPVLTCMLGLWTVPKDQFKSGTVQFPIFQFPESAVKAMSGLRKYSLWKQRQRGKYSSYKVNKERVRKVFDRVRKDKRKHLSYSECKVVLENYGFRFPKGFIVKTADETLQCMSNLEFPVVLKISSYDISHKSDIGGVVTDVRNANELLLAYNKMKNVIPKKSWDKAEGVIIEKMVKGGVETIIGMKHDPKFGSVILFGIGGVLVEILNDFSIKIPPLTDQDAEDMIHSIKGYPLLAGYRGDTPKDTTLLSDLLQRFSNLVMDFEEIDTIDINPLIVLESDAVCVDAKIVLK